MTCCYLGLGSNLRKPERQLRQAIHHLNKLPQSTITAKSRIYLSQPCGQRAQPPYSNMVIALSTALPAEQLLQYCQLIEKKQQRLRKKHWGARTLDIDILLYGDQIIHSHQLIIPHKEMLKRDFVVVPLLEIAPEARLPSGEFVDSYLKHCETHLHHLN